MAKKQTKKAPTRAKTTRKKTTRKKTMRKKTTRRNTTRKKTSRKKTTRKKTASRSKRGTRRLASVPAAELQAELERRQRGAAALQRRREKLEAELARIDAELADLGVRPGAKARASVGSGRRPRNAKTLVETLESVLKGKTMGVSEVAEAVQRAGYRTTSSSFRTIVNQSLISNPKVFKKVARGQYTAR